MCLKLIKIRMSHIGGFTVAFFKPLFLKRQLAKHVVDILANFANSPRSPSPHLRHSVVINRNATSRRFLCDPPVESWIVDQHHGIDIVVLKVLIRLINEPEKELQVADDFAEKHDGHLRQVVDQLTSSGLHLWPTETDKLKVRIGIAKILDQI